MNIYIFNLSSVIGEQDLTHMFSVYGEVQSTELVRDIISGESRGFGYIEMQDDKAARKAIDALDYTEVDTLSVRVQENRS